MSTRHSKASTEPPLSSPESASSDDQEAVRSRDTIPLVALDRHAMCFSTARACMQPRGSYLCENPQASPHSIIFDTHKLREQMRPGSPRKRGVSPG